MNSTFPPVRGSARSSSSSARDGSATVAKREPSEPRRVAWTTQRLDELDEETGEEFSWADSSVNQEPTDKDSFAASDGLLWARTRRRQRPLPVPPTPPSIAPPNSFSYERSGGSADASLGRRNNRGLSTKSDHVTSVGTANSNRSSRRSRLSSSTDHIPSSSSPRLPAISPIRARAGGTTRQASPSPSSDIMKAKRKLPPEKAQKKAKIQPGSTPEAAAVASRGATKEAPRELRNDKRGNSRNLRRPRSDALGNPVLPAVAHFPGVYAGLSTDVDDATTMRAGVFGVKHPSLPGVVHFEYCWDLSTAPARTWRALDRGDHPCRGLVSVLANARFADEERKRRTRGRRAPGTASTSASTAAAASRFGAPRNPSPPPHPPGSAADAAHRRAGGQAAATAAAVAAAQHAAFEIFVVRSFDYGNSDASAGGFASSGSERRGAGRLPPLLPSDSDISALRPSSGRDLSIPTTTSSHAANVRALEDKLQATVASCQRKHAHAIGLALLQTMATVAVRTAWSRWHMRWVAGRQLVHCAAALVLQGQARRRFAQARARKRHAWQALRVPASLWLQKRWRGYTGRLRARARRQRQARESAAVRVQARARGMLARRATRKARQRLKLQRKQASAKRVLVRCMGRYAAHKRKQRAQGHRAARRGAATTLAEWWTRGYVGLLRARQHRCGAFDSGMFFALFDFVCIFFSVI